MMLKMMVMAMMTKMVTPSVVIMMLKKMVMAIMMKMVTPSVVRKVQTAEISKEDTG